MTWNTSFEPLLACKVSFEKSATSVMGTLLKLTVSFPLAAFKILSLFFILGNFMMMCLGVFLFRSNFFGTLDFLEFYFLCQIGKFSFIMFPNKFSISCSSSFPSGTPMIWMLECLKLSWRFLSLSFFFEFLTLHSVLVECLFLLSTPNR